jgi:hypothetical protein
VTPNIRPSLVRTQVVQTDQSLASPPFIALSHVVDP